MKFKITILTTLITAYSFMHTLNCLANQNDISINLSLINPDNSAICDVSNTNQGELILCNTDVQSGTIPSKGTGRILKSLCDSTITFSYTGVVQTWTVPSSVTSIKVEVDGAQGGSGMSNGNPYNFGGLGGKVTATITVTPGEILYIYVGQQGSNAPNTCTISPGGINSGGGADGGTGGYYSSCIYNAGGGGGATDIRLGGTSFANRIIVAGGGGAADDDSHGNPGGGLTGGGGLMSPYQTGGFGGTQTAGGAGANDTLICSIIGNPGGLSFGGNGGTNSPNCGGGGGGGGGYYGGGGGANGPGGGGSSYPDPASPPAGVSNVVHTQGFWSGNGQVSIIFAGGSLPATITPVSSTTFCAGQSVQLNADTGTGYNYQWLNGSGIISGATTSSYTATIADNYLVIVSQESCIATSSPVTVIVNSPPSTTDTMLVNEFEPLYSNVTFTESPGGTGPFSYQWFKNDTAITGATNSTYNISSLICTPKADADTGTYTCNIVNGCATIVGKVAVLTTDCSRFRYSLKGNVIYDSTVSYPIPHATVTLLNSSEQVIGTTETDVNGYYVFMNLVSGTYKLTASRSLYWGGANPTDALVVNRVYIGMFKPLTGLPRIAADVNDDGKINPTDALIINRRYIGFKNSYKINDFLFTNPTTVISGADNTQNILALCAGDVRAADRPALRIMYSNPALMNNTINVTYNQPFDIPVYLNDNLQLGAIGIKLLITNHKLQIIGIKSDLEGLIYNITDDGINIAWSAINEAYNVRFDKPVFYLHCLLSNNVKLNPDLLNSYIQITSESVLADIDVNDISIDKLSIPSLIVNSQQSTVSLICYPNPFSNITNINYSIPEDANVEVNLYNVLGEKMASLVTNECQQEGNHRLQYDGSNLKEGIYYCQLIIENKDLKVSRTNIIMIAR